MRAPAGPFFLVTFLGFGVKAGLVPLNLWIPRAYAAAPGGFAPVLAGATLNLGLYAILRVNADLVRPAFIRPRPGHASGRRRVSLIGILYPTTENDPKSMLGC